MEDISSYESSSLEETKFSEEEEEISSTENEAISRSDNTTEKREKEWNKCIKYNTKFLKEKFFSKPWAILTIIILLVLFLLALSLVIIFVIFLSVRKNFCKGVENSPTYPNFTQHIRDWNQVSENDDAKFILMHIPSYESFFGSLHPTGALFEQGFNLTNAQEQMHEFQSYLNGLGIEVFNIRDVLIRSPRQLLIDSASKYLIYTVREGSDTNDEEILKYSSEEYKLSTLSKMSSAGLVDILLLQPEVELEKSAKNTAVTSVRTSLNPIPNLLFTRDQQITTKRGVVMGRMNSPQRMIERDLLEIVWSELGIVPAGKIPTDEGMFLEGGDFVPMDDDLSMLGVGLRTNYKAAEYLLENDLFGTDEVAIVVDTNDLNQERMHLDTVFNSVSDSVVVLLKSIIDSPDPNDRYYRRVDLYRKNNSNNKYELVDNTMTLHAFLLDRGMKVVPITHEDQLDYMINFLNLGRSFGLASVNPSFKKVLRKANLPEEDVRGVNIKHFDFTDVHAMYGALHCTTQVGRGERGSVVHTKKDQVGGGFLNNFC